MSPGCASFITNMGAELFQGVLDHEEVLRAGKELAVDLERLVRGVLPLLVSA